MTATSGEWVRGLDGCYLFDTHDGWYFDHDRQAWFFAPLPATVPLETSAMARRRLARRLATGWPSAKDALLTPSDGHDSLTGVLVGLVRLGMLGAAGVVLVNLPGGLRGLPHWAGETPRYGTIAHDHYLQTMLVGMGLTGLLFGLALLWVAEVWRRDPAKGTLVMGVTTMAPLVSRMIQNQRNEAEYWRHHPPTSPDTHWPHQ